MGSCASSNRSTRRRGERDAQPASRQNEIEAYGSRVTEAPFFSAAVNETGSQKPAKSDATDVNTDEGDRRLPDAERRCDRSGSDCDTGGVGIGNQSEEDKEEIDDGDGDGQEEEEQEDPADDNDGEEEDQVDDSNGEDEEAEEEPEEDAEDDEKGGEEDEDEEDDEVDDSWWVSTAGMKETTKRIIEGNFDMEIPSQIKIVRIFTSSTFTDTFIERNSLMEKIYPKLKEYCQSIGYDFQVVDMRWGVRDEATDDHMTSELCMRELRACQQLSTGPNFITFLGQKYGYRPFPPRIMHSEFEAMLAVVQSESDKELLTKWFKRDDNIIPAMHILQPIRELIPNYNNREVSSEERSKASGEWWTAFETMQQILRAASKDAALKKAEVSKYLISVTEDEIRRGILRVKDKDKHCFWFKRNIIDLKENLDKGKSRMFIDKAGGELDTEAVDMLESLKADLTTQLPRSSIEEYDVKWHGEQCINPTESVEHKTYVEKLCKDFYDTLVRMIDKGVEYKKNSNIDDTLVKEVSLHAKTCQEKSRIFHGREAILDAIVKHASEENKEKNRILVVHGPSGCGKTSIMAVAAKKIKELHPDVPLVLRFLGTTSESSSISKALYSICKHLSHFTKKKAKEIPESFKKMVEYFEGQLQDIDRRIIIMLDSLDQLTPEDGALAMKWLPKSVPGNVSFVLSTLPGKEYLVLPALKNHLPADAFIEVPVMPEDVAILIFDAWLKDANRTVTEQQRELVISAFSNCPLPLFLKLLFDEAVGWKSYLPIEKCILQSTIKDSINAIFEKLERLHGYHLVSHALAYITASKSGLSDAEIDDILSIDDDVLNDVYQYWTPPLRRIPPLLWIRVKTDLASYIISRGTDGVLVNTWYHRQFFEVARERYVRPENEVKLHEVLVQYFLGKWSGGVAKPFTDKGGTGYEKDRFVPAQPNIFPKSKEKAEVVYNYRKLSELPRHLIKSGDLHGLNDHVVFNFDFLSAKICAFGLRNLLQDFNEALEVFSTEGEIKLLRDTIQMSGKGLLADPNQLAAQLNARLVKTSKHERIGDLLDQSKRANVPCLYPSQPCFEQPGGPLVHSLAGHTAAVQWASLTKDGEMLISVAQNNEMKLWDMKTGTEIRTYQTSAMYSVVRFYNNEKGVVLSGFSGLLAMDLETEEIAYNDKYIVGMYGTSMDILAQETRIVHAGVKKVSVFEVDGKDVKPCWSYEEDAAQNSTGYFDTICGAGDNFAYTRGNPRELMIRKANSQSYLKKLEVPYNLMHFKFHENGAKLVALGSNSPMNAQYKEVFLVVWDASSWTIEKETESKFDAIRTGVHDMSIVELENGWEVVWPVIFQINFWNLNSGVERVALKSGYQGNQYKRAICADGRHLVVVSLDATQRAIEVYDLDAIDYIVGGDKHLSAIDKTKADVGEGERDAYPVRDNPDILVSIHPADPIITMWDVNYQDRIRRIRTEGIFPSAFYYIDEKHMALWDHNTRKIFLIDYLQEEVDGVIDGKVCDTPPTNPHSNTWQHLKDFEFLAVSEDSKSINRWDIMTGKLLSSINTNDEHDITNFVVSEDKTLALAATNQYSSQVPAICIDLRQNKIVGKVTVENQRVTLAPNSFVLSPNGEYFLFVMHRKCMNVYETKTGKKKQDIYFTRTNKPDPKEIHFDVDKNNLFRCMTDSASAGYVVSCVSGTNYNSGKYEPGCWLVCHDLTTFEFLASEVSYYYVKMSTSEDGSRLVCLSQPLGEEAKSVELWDMSAVREGKLVLLGRFLPETDVRFAHITPRGESVCIGIAGVAEVLFLRVCGHDTKRERDEECIEAKVKIDPECYKD